MSLITIKLPQGQWKYDPSDSLGPPGGFGEVFTGEGEGHSELAIKKLHLDANSAAHREMKIAEDLSNRELSYIVPIYDAGLDTDSDSYFVVMARAERSLQNYIDSREVQNQDESISIIMDIANGLREVSDIVHRDLKPGNVLFHDGCWKIADFGIARFFEESTSLQTLKGYLSPQYAAPEQWKYERATNATDVYALGCIGYAVLNGSPPFAGAAEELKEAHLNRTPDRFPDSIHPKLSSLISMMLRKQPSTRPTIERVVGILESLKEDLQNSGGSPAYDELAKAGRSVEHARSERESRELHEQSQWEARIDLALAGKAILKDLIDELFSFIDKAAPNAVRKEPSAIQLGKGTLRFAASETIVPASAFEHSGWNVITGTVIQVTQHDPPYSPSSALWYMDPSGGEVFRWYEVSYWSLVSPRRGEQLDEPNACTRIEDADLAAAPIMHSFNIAFGPRLIDDEDAEDFFERWGCIFARSAKGNLRKPSQFPLTGNL